MTDQINPVFEPTDSQLLAWLQANCTGLEWITASQRGFYVPETGKSLRQFLIWAVKATL